MGAFVGGSETASNVFFVKIQWDTALSTLEASAFMWIFASHAVGGGIASAITSSKITNAAATTGVSGKRERNIHKSSNNTCFIYHFFTGLLLMLYLKI